MANPRNKIKFDGIAPVPVTFIADGITITYDNTQKGGSAVVGRAVRLVPGTPQTVELIGDAEHLLGELMIVEKDLKCTVKIAGVLDLPGGTAATLTPGSKVVGAVLVAAEGYVRSVAAATLAEVAVAEGQILDATDTAHVMIFK